ncbi:MAG: 4-hydroxy-tetrahydrodipicolinate synthase [Robiginitomaculum sp.]|nr:MAG: 4-hydroxy-tetrahydrodipicolinate synthase [Robiginitomaculum sp.]
MITGSITALVTPFKNGHLDVKAYEGFIDWQIRSGTSGLVPCGTTGETSTLATGEHIQAIEICAKVSAGRVPVIAGIGSNNTASAAYMAREAKKAGADAVLAVAPYYNKPSQEGMYQHFKLISQATDLNIIIYNIPGRSVVDIDVETMGRIAQLPHVYGLKDATSDISRITEYKNACGEDFVQLSGDDPTAMAHWAHGGKGCISVAANVAPAQCAAFHKACAEGDFTTARALHEKLDGLFKDLFLCSSPAPAKYALSLLGRMSDDVRLPIITCRDSTKIAVQNAMRKAGVEF